MAIQISFFLFFFFYLYEEIQDVALLIPSILPLPFNICQVSLMAQMVRSLGQEYPLEEEMTTHSSILAWRFHGQRSPVGYGLSGCKESDTTEQLTLSPFFQVPTMQMFYKTHTSIPNKQAQKIFKNSCNADQKSDIAKKKKNPHLHMI